ncbi:MAG TPA: glycosyltransferase [Chroococcidiopsis sp.]
MQSSPKPDAIHLWFPNLFEFKGGIQVYLLDWLNALVRLPRSRPWVVFDKLDRAEPAVNPYTDHVAFWFSGRVPKPLQTLHFAWSLVREALRQRPRLIICGHLNFAPVALLISRLTGIPYWIVVYGVDAWSVRDRLKQAALHRAERVVSISGYTRDRLIAEQHLPAEVIPLLPVTFDASRFAIAPKPAHLIYRYGLHPDQPIILTVTRLSREDGYKGYDQILRALPQIRQQVPNVHYILVGKGDDRPRVERLIAELGLQDCVTLTGFVPDRELNNHYNLCDVFVMPSKGEGFGIVYLEALACGKPTIGGNQDGAIDALQHGELGVLVDPDDVQAIAQVTTQVLLKTCDHPLLYQPERLRQRVIEIFGFERFQATLADLLKGYL